MAPAETVESMLETQHCYKFNTAQGNFAHWQDQRCGCTSERTKTWRVRLLFFSVETQFSEVYSKKHCTDVLLCNGQQKETRKENMLPVLSTTEEMTSVLMFDFLLCTMVFLALSTTGRVPSSLCLCYFWSHFYIYNTPLSMTCS